MKTHKTAVVVIPPEEVWKPIQAIRERYDRSYVRWMPHITLLYPFLVPSRLDEAEPKLREACLELSPFQVELAQLCFFLHASGRYTMWLHPEPPNQLKQLHAELHAQFPDCHETINFPNGFTPHLSVGQALGRAELDERMAEIELGWEPLRFSVQQVAMIWRGDDSPFQVLRNVPLGGERSLY